MTSESGSVAGPPTLKVEYRCGSALGARCDRRRGRRVAFAETARVAGTTLISFDGRMRRLFAVMLHSSDCSPGVSRFTLRGHHLDGLYRDASYRCGGGLWTRHRRQAREQLPHDLDSVALVACKFGRQTFKGITGSLTRFALHAATRGGRGVEKHICVYRLRAVGLHAGGTWGRHVTRTGVIVRDPRLADARTRPWHARSQPSSRPSKTSAITRGPIARSNIAQLFLHAEVERQAAPNPWSPYRILPHGRV